MKRCSTRRKKAERKKRAEFEKWRRAIFSKHPEVHTPREVIESYWIIDQDSTINDNDREVIAEIEAENKEILADVQPER